MIERTAECACMSMAPRPNPIYRDDRFDGVATPTDIPAYREFPLKLVASLMWARLAMMLGR